MIILASGSPRRRDLLLQIGASFRVVVSDAAEESGDALPPEELTVRNASAKAMAVAAQWPDFPVLGADTVVSLDGHIYGKPGGREDAVRMLSELSGRTHQVTTGMALAVGGRVFTDAAVTEVRFAPLSEAEILAYVESGEPLDKAGAYAIQGKAAVFVESLHGSFSNVVGLPLHAAARLARKAGVDLYDHYGKGPTG